MKEIRKIIATYDAANHEKERLALASVVNVEESSYRRIGARMLVSSNGTWVGGISGGCLEGDALKRSNIAIFKNQSSRVVYDTMEDDQNQIGVGLGCNGRLEVLFTPIDPTDENNPIEQLRKIVQLDQPSILLKVIEAKEAPALLGTNQLVSEDLSNLNFCDLDVNILDEAIQETRFKRRPQIVTPKNTKGQTLKVLVEYIRPETKLVIVGDNYDVLSLVGIANEMGWEIHLVGRKKKMSKVLYAKAKAVYEYEECDNVPIDEFTAIILMSHDYNWDKTLLPKFLAQKPSYIGMLGPRKRTVKMQEELGITLLNQVDFFHSPVGLDIGAESPEEIALSIASEIVATFRGRNGTALRLREGPIHERYLQIS